MTPTLNAILSAQQKARIFPSAARAVMANLLGLQVTGVSYCGGIAVEDTQGRKVKDPQTFAMLSAQPGWNVAEMSKVNLAALDAAYLYGMEMADSRLSSEGSFVASLSALSEKSPTSYVWVAETVRKNLRLFELVAMKLASSGPFRGDAFKSLVEAAK